jgi:hypothetical protein
MPAIITSFPTGCLINTDPEPLAGCTDRQDHVPRANSIAMARQHISDMKVETMTRILEWLRNRRHVSFAATGLAALVAGGTGATVFGSQCYYGNPASNNCFPSTSGQE